MGKGRLLMDMERVPLKTRLCWLKNGNDSVDRCVEMLRKQAEMPVLDYCMRDGRILDALGAALHLSREVLFHIDYQSLAEIIMKRLDSPEEEGVGEALQILAVPYLRAMKKIKEGT